MGLLTISNPIVISPTSKWPRLSHPPIGRAGTDHGCHETHGHQWDQCNLVSGHCRHCHWWNSPGDSHLFYSRLYTCSHVQRSNSFGCTGSKMTQHGCLHGYSQLFWAEKSMSFEINQILKIVFDCLKQRKSIQMSIIFFMVNSFLFWINPQVELW